MSERDDASRVRVWAGCLCLLTVLAQGCRSVSDCYDNVSGHEEDFGLGFFETTGAMLAQLPEEYRERMERIKGGLAVEVPEKVALFPEAYRAGYEDGYALCMVTGELIKRGVRILTDGCILHLFSSGWVVSPLHEVYVTGWDDGQDAAYEKLPRGIQALRVFSESQD